MKDVKNRWMNPGYSKYTHQVFMTQLSAEECGVFQEKLFKFPGFYIQRRTIRQYTYNSAGHLLGDIGEVSKKDIENDDYYIRGDYIGKQGIEGNPYESICVERRGWRFCFVTLTGASRDTTWTDSWTVPPYPART